MIDRAQGADGGFTIIEALVALMIVAIAAAGLIRAAEAHVDTVREIELRTIAQWVAEEHLTMLGLANRQSLPTSGEVEMLGHRWSTTETMRTSDDPDLRRADIVVHEVGRPSPQTVLHGFVDTGTGGR